MKEKSQLQIYKTAFDNIKRTASMPYGRRT